MKIPIPQAAYDVVQGLIDLSKKAAVAAQAHEKRANDLEAELKRVSAQRPAAGAPFDKKQVTAWVEQLKIAGFIAPSSSSEKMASQILNRPQDLIDMLIQAQLPPEAQGSPYKEASAEKSDEPVLVDHDGWTDCIRPGV